MKTSKMIKILKKIVKSHGDMTIRFFNTFAISGLAVGRATVVKNDTFYVHREKKFCNFDFIALEPLENKEMKATELIAFLQATKDDLEVCMLHESISFVYSRRYLNITERCIYVALDYKE